MKERPIIFNTDMVQSIMNGHKYQTRRVIKPQPDGSSTSYGHTLTNSETRIFALKDGKHEIPCPYGVPGDRLYVRETWCGGCKEADPYCHCDTEDLRKENHFYVYKADTPDAKYPLDWDDVLAESWNMDADFVPRWKPSIHMPKEAARIWLAVVDVRVERIRDITASDIKKKGVRIPVTDTGGVLIPLTSKHFPPPKIDHGHMTEDAWLRAFWIELWDSINAGRGYSYQSNPWVWVVEFRKISTTGRPEDEV